MVTWCGHDDRFERFDEGDHTVHKVAGGACARFDSDIGTEVVEFGLRLGMVDDDGMMWQPRC